MPQETSPGSVDGYPNYQTVEEFRRREGNTEHRSRRKADTRVLRKEVEHQIGSTLRINQDIDVHILAATDETCTLAICANRGAVIDAVGSRASIDDTDLDARRLMHVRELEVEDGALLLGHCVLLDGIKGVDDGVVTLRWVYRRTVWDPEAEQYQVHFPHVEQKQWLASREQSGDQERAA